MVQERKFRIGSTPPSCHNRCNSCSPCMAVQVPTLPVRSSSGAPLRASYIMYSNYKPLGWKCQCGNQLFNP
ncbi:hypothetical protein IHE45_19G042200 [Dioscorea alata]|nr:hypothetical protein IHE45_19G042200 [Dioscorea alata]